LYKVGDFVTASARFQEVTRLAAGRPELRDLTLDALKYLGDARLTVEVRAAADSLFQAVAKLRYQILDGDEAGRDLAGLLAPFRVLDDLDWIKQPKFVSLDSTRRQRLIREVDEILFQYASTIDPKDRQSIRRGIEIANRALAFTDDRKPWQALRSWLDDSPLPTLTEEPSVETSAKSAFEWALLADRQGKARSASTWFSRATYLDPGNAWYHFQYATVLARADASSSVEQFTLAISLDPENRRYRLDRARAYRSIGEWGLALEDEGWASRTSSAREGRSDQPSR
jgi:tetratricopeptide (TPR) repeat protein